ncbi:hypothetical protein BC830DRAFT_1115653 [Chytriomyces sp. MP71]|nr:hypothetical protein BC830DRAFT_1115653 [Chytriomyces sp. MP71]
MPVFIPVLVFIPMFPVVLFVFPVAAGWGWGAGAGVGFLAAAACALTMATSAGSGKSDRSGDTLCFSGGDDRAPDRGSVCIRQWD